MIIFKLTG